MDPHPEVLSRDLTERKRVLDIFGGLLTEAVNFGTNLFAWCVAARPSQTDLTISALLHQFVETMDGAEVLVRQGATEPLKLVLRSALESYLSLLYILDRDTELRAVCYRVADIRRRIKFLRQHDLATPQGKAFRAEIAKDTTGFATAIGEKSYRDTSQDVARLETALDSEDDTRRVHADWKARRKASGWDPPWYALLGGPANFCDLAAGLGYSGWYRILYAGWSATMHAEDALARVEIHAQNNEMSVRAMRHPEDLQVLTSMGASMAIRVYERIVRTRLPDREAALGLWYAGVRVPYGMVSNPDPMIRIRTKAKAPKA